MSTEKLTYWLILMGLIYGVNTYEIEVKLES